MHNPIQAYLWLVELQQRRCEISSSRLIQIRKPVRGGIPLHGNSQGNLAKEFFYNRWVKTVKDGIPLQDLRSSVLNKSEGSLSPRWPTMIFRVGNRLSTFVNRTCTQTQMASVLTRTPRLCIIPIYVSIALPQILGRDLPDQSHGINERQNRLDIRSRVEVHWYIQVRHHLPEFIVFRLIIV